MRIALVPLDSRPPSWQFPLRIAQIANVELVSPPRELLGTLHKGADQRALLRWLSEAAKDADAAVPSWDALVYGGLVQSRAEGSPLPIKEVRDALSAIDWQRCAGYLWLTVPRLGMTVASWEDKELHQLLIEYFKLWGEVSAEPSNEKLAAKLHSLEVQIGADRLAQAWALRRRNIDNAREAMRLAASLGFRTCHVAVEDNARTGPHLDEVAELRKLALELTAECRREGREPPRFTFFDGTDECGSLLTARAILDERNAPPLPVRLTLFPSSPSPDQYFGLYESHSLDDGLQFLAKFLGFEYRAEGKVQWLVCFGKQPQPDVFAVDALEVFNNALLLPDKLEGDEPLFLADLQACNGGNPYLLNRIAALALNRLASKSAWNTNFNALGFSAASIAAFHAHEWKPTRGAYALTVERTLDDYVYQSILRPMARDFCIERGWNPLDLSALELDDLTSLKRFIDLQIRERAYPIIEPYVRHSGLDPLALWVNYELPWNRVFEVLVSADGC